MPELPEVETVRRLLSPAMRGARFDEVLLRRRDLRLPFPRRFRERLIGRTALSVDRRAKYLLVPLSSGETLMMHLGMSGWFRVNEGSGVPHDHVVFAMSSGALVVFNDPRRFGLIDLIPEDGLAKHPVLSRLGPEPLSPQFDGYALARACRGKRTPLKVALLDQRVVAGVGNIYASEALHLAGLSPRRQAATIATPSGLPRPSAHRLAAAIKKVLMAAIARKADNEYGGSRFRVYDREAERCRRAGCSGRIRRYAQAGRSTFYCTVCQR